MLDSYDGIDHRYSSTDADKSKAIAIVANILGVSPRLDGLEYLLCFYAGGSGHVDRLAIRCAVEATDWPIIYKNLRLRTLDQALGSPDWRERFDWFTDEDAQADEFAAAVRHFLDTHKQPFQDGCDDAVSAIAITDESDVNTWCFVWEKDGWLNYLSFDQG